MHVVLIRYFFLRMLLYTFGVPDKVLQGVGSSSHKVSSKK